MDTPVIARHHRVAFDLDPDTGWYTRRNGLVTVTKLPPRLKVEVTQEQRIRSQGADHVITGPMRAKRRTFFTGLRPLPIDDWYIGNDYEQLKGKTVLSLVLFEFSPDKATLTVYYFSRYYKADRDERTRFAVEFIRYQERQRAA